MPLFEIYRTPICVKHKNVKFSKPLIFNVMFTVVIIVIPFLAAYKSYGFWERTLEKNIKANVTFQYGMIVNFVSSLNGLNTWSTINQYNLLHQNQMQSIPLITAWEEDDDHDGYFERLSLNVSLPLLNAQETISSVKILLFFNYQINSYSTLAMKSFALLQVDSPVGGSAVSYASDLVLYQRYPLQASGSDVTYNRGDILPYNSQALDSFEIDNIVANASARNKTLQLINQLAVWKYGSPTNQRFTVNATINYPTQNIIFYSTIWYLLNWAWVQYLATFFIFRFIFGRMRLFTFQNQLLATMLEMPVDTHHTKYHF